MKGEISMSTEQNKMLLRRFYEEVFNQGSYAVLDEIFAPNYINHNPGNPPGVPNDREGLRQIVTLYRNAVSGIHFTIDDMIAEGDTVICRWTSTGTHTGDLLGIAPTGKSATVTGTDIERVENGKLAEGWGVFDQLGLLQQLGVIPAMGVQSQADSPSTQARRSDKGPSQPGMGVSAE
jgi:predicted ester cyclase